MYFLCCADGTQRNQQPCRKAVQWAVKQTEQTHHFRGCPGCRLGASLLLFLGLRCEGPSEDRPDLLTDVLTRILGGGQGNIIHRSPVGSLASISKASRCLLASVKKDSWGLHLLPSIVSLPVNISHRMFVKMSKFALRGAHIPPEWRDI